MGVVEELGPAVTLLKKGDRIVMPFNVADGRCRNCEEGKTAFCEGVNPGFAGGAYGERSTQENGCLPGNKTRLLTHPRLRGHGAIPRRSSKYSWKCILMLSLTVS
jgi:threonine dehydrogenase-like Zn-dependent dehydrogenase